MAERSVAPYGSWESPITADLIADGVIRLAEIALDGEDVYWLEMRPTEGGRNVIVRRTPDGRTRDVTPASFNVRTRVHEYGGGAYAVADGTIYFSNFADQRLYRQDPGEQPLPLTPALDMRYADAVVDQGRGRLICVREDHTASDREAANTVVSLDLAGSLHSGRVLVSGNDFYAAPRLSPDGSRLAWITWNQPNMPWDGTELWTAPINDDGSLGPMQQIAGGPDESVLQPQWSPESVLHFISDRTGWWNLYRWQEGQIQSLCPKAAEFAGPQWVLGLSSYGFEPTGPIFCTYREEGRSHLARLHPQSGRLEPIETPYSAISYIQIAPGRAFFLAGSPTELPAIVQMDRADAGREVLRRAGELAIDAGYFSVPEAVEFPTVKGLTAHAFYYAPRNPDYTAPGGERPPLLVISHGGPTSATSNILDLRVQYWTSRGLAVLDVNYGGSTGYGRSYRQRLNGQWGIVDVDDCVNGARYLVQQGRVDPERLAIRGGSAGGYTTLAALTFRDYFKAGASYYGVSDLEALATDTHKFESRYLDNLIGPYPARQDLYMERSPIHFVERLSCPLIFFQGLEDKVVPPDQAERMVDALRQKGIPVAYVPFAGEQHGFRRAENIKRSLEAELYFYSRIFGFELAQPVEPVTIENMP